MITPVADQTAPPHHAAVPAPRPGIALPYTTRRDLSKLLAQQFWLFGCDIRRPEGNLLLNLGFERLKPPPDSRFSASRYTNVMDDGRTLVLWGFGLFWTHPQEGAIFLSRHRFAPLLHSLPEPPANAWDPNDIPGLMKPVDDVDIVRCQQRVLELAEWISTYEAYVLEEAGVRYREEAIRAWRKPTGTATELAGMWGQGITDLTAVFNQQPR